MTTKESKAELIQRLSKQDPNVWTSLRKKLERMPREEGMSTSAIAPVGGETDKVAEAEEYASIPEENRAPLEEIMSLLRDERDDYTRRELTLIQKERELLERERQFSVTQRTRDDA